MNELRAAPVEKRTLDRDRFLAVLRRTEREEYSFYNEPVEVDAGEVERLIADLRRESRRLAGLYAVYLDSDPRDWPVSPRRLVAVYDEETVNSRNQKFDEVLRIVGTRNILSPEFLSIDRFLLENLPKLDCLIRPQRIYGDEISGVATRESEIRFFNISRVQDLLSTGYLESFWTAEVERQVDTRAFLGRLAQFSRLLEVVKEILRRPSAPAWDRLDADIAKLARLVRDGTGALRMLMNLARVLHPLFEIIARLDAFFARALVVNIEMEDPAPYRALVATESFISCSWTAGPRTTPWSACCAGTALSARPCHRPARLFRRAAARIHQGQQHLLQLHQELFYDRGHERQHGAQLHQLGARQAAQPLSQPLVDAGSGPAGAAGVRLQPPVGRRLQQGGQPPEHQEEQEPPEERRADAVGRSLA
ncbi:hypothetical protein HS125_19425 [bacterium]|nr:hypothetical protein [bacterium]